MKTTIKVLAAVLLLSFSACKDKDKKVSPQITTRDRIAEKDWELFSWTISPALQTDSGPVTDLYEYWIPTCGQDDFLRFLKDGTIRIDEGIEKCNSQDPQTSIDGTWSLTNDGKTLTLNSDGETTNFTVESVAEFELKLTNKEMMGGTEYTIYTTFRVR